MLITCPSCASEYTIDPAHVGAEGRTVRCAACRTTWFADGARAEGITPPAEPSEDEWSAAIAAEAPPAVAPPEPEEAAPLSVEAEVARDAPVAPTRTRKPKAPRAKPGAARRVGARLAASVRAVPPALALTILVLALATGAVAGRATVVQALPETARLYAGLGLPVDLRGLAFREVMAETLTEPAGTFLVVEGEIANVTRRPVDVPAIALALRAALDGPAEPQPPLYAWTVDPPRGTLSEGESARFRARLASPPAEARAVLVRFAPLPPPTSTRDGAGGPPAVPQGSSP